MPSYLIQTKLLQRGDGIVWGEMFYGRPFLNAGAVFDSIVFLQPGCADLIARLEALDPQTMATDDLFGRCERLIREDYWQVESIYFRTSSTMPAQRMVVQP